MIHTDDLNSHTFGEIDRWCPFYMILLGKCIVRIIQQPKSLVNQIVFGRDITCNILHIPYWDNMKSKNT